MREDVLMSGSIYKGEQGMSGPTSITQFEIKDGSWTQKHVELDSLCLAVLKFLEKNPELHHGWKLQGI